VADELKDASWLIKKQEPGPEPKLVLAKDLESAQLGTMVHVDRHGQTRSPARYKVITAVQTAAVVTMLGGAAWIYHGLLGTGGLYLAAAITGYVGWAMFRATRLRTAALLIMQNRLDEAEALLNKWSSTWGMSTAWKGAIEQNWAAIFHRRGQYEKALHHIERALRIYRKGPKRLVNRRTAEHAEIHLLVTLGRLGEARERFSRLVQPKGNLLAQQHWAAELHLLFGEGAHRLDADTLHARARQALGITLASAPLALLAWAHWKAGDDDQAWHLLRESYARLPGIPIQVTMPDLFAWMEAHRVEAFERA
jgi:tetratricopeptide (TPR) repeat protein